jgi:hypothetical protein
MWPKRQIIRRVIGTFVGLTLTLIDIPGRLQGLATWSTWIAGFLSWLSANSDVVIRWTLALVGVGVGLWAWDVHKLIWRKFHQESQDESEHETASAAPSQQAPEMMVNPLSYVDVHWYPPNFRYLREGNYIEFTFIVINSNSDPLSAHGDMKGHLHFGGIPFPLNPELKEAFMGVRRGDHGLIVIRQYLRDADRDRVMAARAAIDDVPKPSDPHFALNDVKVKVTISDKYEWLDLPTVPLTPGRPLPPPKPTLTIHSATWGTGWEHKDVTDIITKRIEDGQISMRITPGPYLVDWYQGSPKYLKVVYSFGEHILRDLIIMREGDDLVLPDPRSSRAARKLLADLLGEFQKRLNDVKRTKSGGQDATALFTRARDYLSFLKRLGEATNMVIDHWQLPNDRDDTIDQLLLQNEYLQKELSPFARGEREHPPTSN